MRSEELLVRLLEIGPRQDSQPNIWAVRYAGGDNRQEAKLVDHVRTVLRKRFVSLGLSPQVVEDLVQETTVAVFSSLKDFDPDKGPLDNWLSGYARNVARSWWRGDYSRSKAESPLESVSELAESDTVDLGGSGALETALGELSLVDQELLLMRFGLGHSFEEIAALTDLSVVNARKRVSRAVECLRRCPELRAELGF